MAAEARDHFGEHVIVAYPEQIFGNDFHRHVAVAEMPGDAEQSKRRSSHLEHRLGRGPHPDPAPAFEHEPVALGETRYFGEIEQHLAAPLRPQQETAAMTVIEVEHDLIERFRLRPVATPENADRSPRLGSGCHLGPAQNRK
jgi:hypothetical protein